MLVEKVNEEETSCEREKRRGGSQKAKELKKRRERK